MLRDFAAWNATLNARVARPGRLLGAALLLSGLAAVGAGAACSADPDAAESPAARSGGDDDGDGGPAIQDLDEAGQPTNPGDIGTEELCDGLDGNDNGIIDDVDVGRDGICDCLRVAILGSLMSTADDTNVTQFASWLESRSTETVVQIPTGTPLTPDVLNPYKVIIVANIAGAVITPDDVYNLSQWVGAGGGLMTLAGFTENSADMNGTNTLIQPYGVSYQLTGGAGIMGGGEPSTPVTGFMPHPISTDVDKVGVYFAYPITGQGDVVVQQGGYILGMAQQPFNGKLFVWADEWIMFSNQWNGTQCTDCSVERFWINIFSFLMPDNECQVPPPPIVE